MKTSIHSKQGVQVHQFWQVFTGFVNKQWTTIKICPNRKLWKSKPSFICCWVSIFFKYVGLLLNNFMNIRSPIFYQSRSEVWIGYYFVKHCYTMLSKIGSWILFTTLLIIWLDFPHLSRKLVVIYHNMHAD